MTVGIDQVIDVSILSLFTASSLCLRRKVIWIMSTDRTVLSRPC